MTPKLLLTALSLSLFLPACSGSDSSPKDGGGGDDEDAQGPDDGDAGGGPGGSPGGDLDGGGSDGGGTPGGNRDGGGAAAGGDAGRDAGTGRDASTPNRDGGPVNCSKAPSFATVKLETVVDGLNQLVYAAQPPGSSDWYLVEQGGTIRVFSGGQMRAGNILDVRSEIGTPKDGGDERGLLGLAFPPDFDSSGLFYVMMTPRNGGIANHDLVREYRRTDTGSTLVRTLLDLGESPENHNGGTVLFGPDNLLYIGTGDSGEGCGNMGLPQMLDSRFGKILRIDPKQSGTPSPAVVHYGLRNPFRFSFDSGSGDLFIGDVGEDKFEEIDIAPAGSSQLNFGWPVFEANVTTNCGLSLRSGSTHTKPVLDFGRRDNGCTGQLCDWTAIIGGVVYRGAALPELYGAYIFADFSEEYVAAFFHCSPTMRSANGTVRRTDLGFAYVSGFVEDSDGELYFVADRAQLMKLVKK